jgi:hypothetical protein
MLMNDVFGMLVVALLASIIALLALERVKLVLVEKRLRSIWRIETNVSIALGLSSSFWLEIIPRVRRRQARQRPRPCGTSGLPSITDMARTSRNVRVVPRGDLSRCSNMRDQRLLNHLISVREQRR